MLKRMNEANHRPQRRGIFSARLREQHRLCTEHYRLTLEIAEFPSSAPGQFVELQLPELGLATDHLVHEWSPQDRAPAFSDPYLQKSLPFLRRPYSIAGRRDHGGHSEISVIYRVIGKFTSALERLRAGAEISVLGPLGNGFAVPQDVPRVILVGGGVGIPPMLYLAEDLAKRHIPTMALIGVQRRDLLPLRIIGDGPSTLPVPLPCIEEFARWQIPAIITTDDGSLGVRGRVTEALDFVLQQLARPKVLVCCCGPTAMMRATAAVAAHHQVDCMASLEQPMACGMGTCQSCVVKYKLPESGEWCYKLTCTDGPVFNCRDIIWN